MSPRKQVKRPTGRAPKTGIRQASKVEDPPERIDGRTRRATGRNLRFGATVHPDWKSQLDRLADQLGTMYVEVLERALDALDRELAEESEAPSKKSKPAAGPRRAARKRR